MCLESSLQMFVFQINLWLPFTQMQASSQDKEASFFKKKKNNYLGANFMSCAYIKYKQAAEIS